MFLLEDLLIWFEKLSRQLIYYPLGLFIYVIWFSRQISVVGPTRIIQYYNRVCISGIFLFDWYFYLTGNFFLQLLLLRGIWHGYIRSYIQGKRTGSKLPTFKKKSVIGCSFFRCNFPYIKHQWASIKFHPILFLYV